MKSFKHTSSSQQRREQTIIQITDNSTRRKNSNNNQSMTLELSNSSRIRIHERESCRIETGNDESRILVCDDETI